MEENEQPIWSVVQKPKFTPNALYFWGCISKGLTTVNNNRVEPCSVENIPNIMNTLWFFNSFQNRKFLVLSSDSD